MNKQRHLARERNQGVNDVFAALVLLHEGEDSDGWSLSVWNGSENEVHFTGSDDKHYRVLGVEEVHDD